MSSIRLPIENELTREQLTVRDAQRNARDTEILVTLVRSAAEMRNSFEDMKRYIAEQDEVLIDVGNKQHERTQRTLLGGPRPQPSSAPRTPRRTSADDADELSGAKRRNVFRRALKGLSAKNSGDVANIELMMHRLLDEVRDLKDAQYDRPARTPLGRPGYSPSSYEQLRDAPQDGYEPSGRAGTASDGDQSGYFSNPPSRQGSRPSGYDRRHASGNRVSTVLEEREDGEEDELEPHEQDALDYEDNQLTPTREMPRGGSVPLDTPPTAHFAAANATNATQSAENTPRTDKSRKHKSSSSSFFPKITSRWSKTTTASSFVDNFRPGGANNKKGDRPISGVSQSGSEDVGRYDTSANYDPQGDDRIRSNTSFAREENNITPTQERGQHRARPASPLVPSAVSAASEKPQYSAHRDSTNLQHPQPRQGPTARYRNHLESQVRDESAFRGGSSSPMSPSSDQFGSNPVLARFGGMGGGAGNRNSGGAGPPPAAGGGSGHLSPISDRGYEGSQTGPPRPPKVRDDGPLVPPKEPPAEHAGNRTFAERAGATAEYGQVRYAPRPSCRDEMLMVLSRATAVQIRTVRRREARCLVGSPLGHGRRLRRGAIRHGWGRAPRTCRSELGVGKRS